MFRPKQQVIPPDTEKTPHQQLSQFYFKPGVSPNPSGRPKGSRHKFAEVFLKDFLADWELHGAEVIQRCREEDPAVFLKVAASILPKDLHIKEGESAIETLLEQFGDDQLDKFITGIIALGTSKGSQGSEVKAVTGKKSDGVH